MMELKIEYVKIDSIKPYKGNAKKHPKKQIEQIKQSIIAMKDRGGDLLTGFKNPLGVWHNEIATGHGRYIAAKELGLETIPIIRLDSMTDEQRRAYIMIDNQLTLNTENDLKQLAIELESIKSIDMPAFSLDLPEINLQIGEIQAKHEVDKERTDFADYNFLNTGYGIFDGAGKYEIPIINPVYELPEIREWIGFNYVLSDKEPEGKAVHFFLDDYQFERLWNKPKQYIDKLRRYVCVCSPDFSPMPHMPFATQIFNHYRKHWVARFLQENGVTVIPTVRAASDVKSFEYCFDGEPENSIVMYSAQWTQNKANREISQKEYDEMINRLNPSKIFVYQNSDKEWLDFRGRNIEKVKMFRQSHWRYIMAKTRTAMKRGSTAQLIGRFEKDNYANQSEKGLLVMADGTTKSFGGVEHHVTGNADDLKLMDGATFTHNHPTDVTFSTDDIANGIVKGNLKELRAVTSSGVIHILTNNGATIEQRRKFNTDFQQAKIKARNVAHKRQRRGDSVDVEKYVNERSELFMAENAEKYGLKYQKKQLR